MIDDQKLTEAIGQADPRQLSRILADGLTRLGEHGRDGAAALLERLQARQLDSPADHRIDEGLAQISAVEGVLDGRLDAL